MYYLLRQDVSVDTKVEKHRGRVLFFSLESEQRFTMGEEKEGQCTTVRYSQSGHHNKMDVIFLIRQI